MKGFILLSLGNEGPEMAGPAIRTDSTETPTTKLFYL